MLSVKRKQNNPATEKKSGTTPLQMPGTVNQYSPVGQPFPTMGSIAGDMLPAPQQFPVTGALLPEQGNENRQLVEVATGPLPNVPANAKTGTLRSPMVIRGTGKKSSITMLPPKPTGKRLFLHSTVTIILVMLVMGALFAVLPIGAGNARGIDLLGKLANNMVDSKTTNTGLIQAQIATATAVTQDGYDAGNQTYAGVNAGGTSTGNISASDAGSLSRFFLGQCTYWANMRYHQLTGHFIPWLGNANQWYYGALNAGWVVRSTPNPNGPSIIVLQAGVQGAGPYGHVAVVEGGTTSTTMSTSNYNWAGAWNVETWVTFSVGSGVSFVWYPTT